MSSIKGKASCSGPTKRGKRGKGKRPAGTPLMQDLLELSTIVDLDKTQLLACSQVGELSDGRKALIFYNKACLSPAEMQEARETLAQQQQSMSGPPVVSGDSISDLMMQLAIQTPPSQPGEPGKAPQKPSLGIKAYPMANTIDLFDGDETSLQAFSDEWTAEESNVAAAAGRPLAWERDPLVSVSCFSPYFKNTKEMSDNSYPPPASGVETVSGQENREVAEKMMLDSTWVQISPLKYHPFRAKELAPLMYEIEKKAPVRICPDRVCSDKITGWLLAAGDDLVDSVQYMRHPRKPWLLSAIIFLVQPGEAWERFMGRCKTLETRFFCWYARNRMSCAVELCQRDAKGELKSIARYEPLPVIQTISEQVMAMGAPYNIPLVRVVEPLGFSLRQSHLSDDARDLLA